MNKIYVFCYSLIGFIILCISAYFNYENNSDSIWYINLVFVTPLLLFSSASIHFLLHNRKNISLSDLIFSICLFFLYAAVLTWLPRFIPNLFKTRVSSSNIILFGATFMYSLSIIYERKVKGSLVSKRLKCISMIIYYLIVFTSVINCFTQVARYKFS